jgi:(2R)-3-sulfolactate dehydrogenase (NADP+)
MAQQSDRCVESQLGTDDMPLFSLREAHELVVQTLARARTGAENAASVARALVAAEADGLKGHGLSRLPGYAAQAKIGKVDGLAKAQLMPARPGLLVIDAANGFAFPALELATEALPEIVRGQGVACSAIRRSHHCGAAGHVVERLANVGLPALMLANTPAAIAPWGGSKAVFGTNPVAFACPLERRAPLVIDLSLSKVARGNIVMAKLRGEKIPLGWALDEHGQSTDDPEAALRGTMLPSGEAKGTALALMVELLAAGLTGSNFAAEASSYLDAKGPPPGTGQLIIAFDPAAFGGEAVARFTELAASIEAQDGARLPGARRLAARTKAAAEGFDLSDALLAEIKAV